ncbi:serine hydrolase [Sciscionella marina]|uniref:serine hydrolase n=1 Tax=Sciscionella marina TaxID=508770 RepID=UPI0003679DB2|nr:serine hydrolase [Sciscionella marina]
MSELGDHASVWCGRPGRAPVFAHRAEIAYYAASLMKLPLLAAAYRAGALDLAERVPVHAEFASAHSGRFSLDHADDNDEQPWELLGRTATLGWLCERMIVASSNLATNLVLERTGIPAVATECPPGMRVLRGIGDATASAAGISNTVTAASVAALLARFAADEELLAVLDAAQYRDCIPAALPPGTKVGNKSGWVDRLLHDAAIIRPADAPAYVLVVCTSGLDEGTALELIHEVTATTWSLRAEEPHAGH